jgi:hypothetical protein
MKIYHNSRFVAVLKRFLPHRNGDWLGRLIGINLQDDELGDINIFPVYRCLQVRRNQGNVFIGIPVFHKELLVHIGSQGIHFKLIDASMMTLSDVGMPEKTTSK